MNTFGLALKVLRRSKQVSLEQLGDHIGYSKIQLLGIESGTLAPLNRDNIWQVLQYLESTFLFEDFTKYAEEFRLIKESSLSCEKRSKYIEELV